MSSGSNISEFTGPGSSPGRWKAVRFERPVVLLSYNLGRQEVTANACTIVVGAKGCLVRTIGALPFEGRVSLCCSNKVVEGELKISEPLEKNFAADLLGRVQYIILRQR